MNTSDGEKYISETGLVRIGDTFSGQSEDLAPSPEVIEGGGVKNIIKIHTVQKGESIRSISDQYGVSTNAILWANDLSPDDDLQIGQKLKVPPVSGVVHHVVAGDTISGISAKYDIEAADIVSVNMLKDAGSIRIGMDLMIPGAMKGATPTKTAQKAETDKQKEKPAVTPAKAKAEQVAKKSSKNEDVETPPPATLSSKTGVKDRYTVKYTGKGRGFVPGNCTWYVAQNKNVTWRGNANQWMRNARAEGVKTGSTPVPGAIIQFSGGGYSRAYGHVGIVADVTDEYVIVKDMNYRGLYEVTIRKVPIDSDAIDGYIYVD